MKYLGVVDGKIGILSKRHRMSTESLTSAMRSTGASNHTEAAVTEHSPKAATKAKKFEGNWGDSTRGFNTTTTTNDAAIFSLQPASGEIVH